ncbi:hypothetical protein l11_13590 [Neisseria weaveri LMG 5135]|nr:hypothetical protein l11_13590 [Neisseria weaveri LMG 5135]
MLFNTFNSTSICMMFPYGFSDGIITEALKSVNRAVFSVYIKPASSMV